MMVWSVDPTVESSLRGPQDFEFNEVIRPRPAKPIKASGGRRRIRKAGHMTASDHRSHQQNVLASRGPSTHGPYAWTAVPSFLIGRLGSSVLFDHATRGVCCCAVVAVGM
jgi:hypothetical protein